MHTCHTGLQDFEQKRLQIIKDGRTQRKNGQPPQGPATTYDCTICGHQQRTQRKNGQSPQGPATTYDCTICGHQQRTQRKNGQPLQGPSTTYDCTICGRQCMSPIGFTTENTMHSGRDSWFDGSLYTPFTKSTMPLGQNTFVNLIISTLPKSFILMHCIMTDHKR